MNTSDQLTPGTPDYVRVMAALQDVVDSLKDGAQWKDLWRAVPRVMEIVETLASLKGEAKKSLCLELFDGLLYRVNLPGPDFLVRPAIKAALPYVIDLIIQATQGEFVLNKGA